MAHITDPTSPASSTPPATFYTFAGSMWGAAATIGLHEKGYTKDVDFVERQVNLVKGENFSPEFLRINPKGTIPTLVVPLAHTVGEGHEDVETRFQALTDSTEILEFVDRSRNASTIPLNGRPAPALSPATIDAKAQSDKLIKLIHEEMAPDGNLLMLSVRDEHEVAFKQQGSGSIAYAYLKGRQTALQKYSQVAATNSMKAFLAARLQENTELLSIYQGTAAIPIRDAFFLKSRQAWTAISTTLAVLADVVTINGGLYMLGAQFSLVDIHVGAWLARLFALVGGSGLSDTQVIQKLEQAQRRFTMTLPTPTKTNTVAGNEVSQKQETTTTTTSQSQNKNLNFGEEQQGLETIKAYWERLAIRKSFETVYANGLH